MKGKTVNNKLMVSLLAVTVVFGSTFEAKAETNAPSLGSITVSMANKYISPTLGTVRDIDYGLLEGWLNLPAGLSLQVAEYVGLNDDDLNSDKSDELDLAVWKKFALSAKTYLKFRVKYIDLVSITDLNGDDLASYDAYLGQTQKWDANTVTAEMRVQYWHYIRDLDEGMVMVMPSLGHEYKVKSYSFYDRIGLQWNQELAPFGELLNGQSCLGVKVKLSPSLTWNIVDVTGVFPLTDVADKDPRGDGDIALTTGLNWRF